MKKNVKELISIFVYTIYQTCVLCILNKIINYYFIIKLILSVYFYLFNVVNTNFQIIYRVHITFLIDSSRNGHKVSDIV